MLNRDSSSVVTVESKEVSPGPDNSQPWTPGYKCEVVPLDANRRSSGERAYSLICIVKGIVAKTARKPSVDDADIWLGLPRVFSNSRSEKLRPEYLAPPTKVHRALIVETAEALEASEQSGNVVEFAGGEQWVYATCPDVAKALRMYVAWTEAGEHGRFWQAIERVFNGRNASRDVREAANRRHKAIWLKQHRFGAS